MPRFAAATLASTLVVGCAGSSAVPVEPVQESLATPASAARSIAHELGSRSIAARARASVALCAASYDPARAACLGLLELPEVADTSGSIAGLAPSDLASLYGISPSARSASRAIVGVVVAYDYAGAESDLAVYRSHFGLPPCSRTNGCFRKVGAAATTQSDDGGQGDPSSVSAHPTAASSGWAAEVDADIEAISAVCGTCRIVVAEAASDSLPDLASAVHAAVASGATIVDASFGAPESSSQLALESAFEPAPVKVVAAAGDAGPQALFPAAATNVVAVSGTSIDVFGFLVTESLWPKSGGGCSKVFARPAYQPTHCGSKRSIADLAVVADPADGIAFFDSGVGGWGIIGGTSIASPIVAAMFALSGDAAVGNGSQQIYAHSLFDFAPVFGGGSLAGSGAPTSLAAF